MSSELDRDPTPKIKRRDFLSSAALPVAAALAPSVLSAQERRASRAASPERIRVGIIGAGDIVGSVHIPGLRRMPGVEIVAVANRSLESSRRAAAEFKIPRAYADWEQLLAADGIDAVLIGTWPYMHRAITLAALDSGRHVLCQARMANNAAEAHEMLAASKRHPNLVCALVPSSSGYSIDRALQRLLADKFVGDVLSVEVQRLQRGFRKLRRRARLAPQPGVQRLQRAERRGDLRIDDALARSRQPRDGPDPRPHPDQARREGRAARGDDTGSRRSALRAGRTVLRST